MKAAVIVGSAAALLFLEGCGKGQPAAERPPVTVTNTVEVRREVVVTNLVTVAVTNVVTVARDPERSLSARRTAPYAVTSDVLDADRLRRLASEAGVRVISCAPGAVALVEARESSLSALRAGGVMTVTELGAEDKIAADAVGEVRVLPLSSIDVASVVEAIRGIGGEIVQVVTVGKPAVRAKLTATQMRKLAVRGDVRRIERDSK